jgi:hypothetical protein
MIYPLKLTITASLLTLITACGGGGSSASSNSGQSTVSPISYSLFTPSVISSSTTNGAASFPTPVNDYGQGAINLADENITGTLYRGATSNSLQLYPLEHLIDTNAKTAWTAGWTGKGQSISIIDEADSITKCNTG